MCLFLCLTVLGFMRYKPPGEFGRPSGLWFMILLPWFIKSVLHMYR